MGVPTSEVGYTIATTRRETTKVHKNMWRHWGVGNQWREGEREGGKEREREEKDANSAVGFVQSKTKAILTWQQNSLLLMGSSDILSFSCLTSEADKLPFKGPIKFICRPKSRFSLSTTPPTPQKITHNIRKVLRPATSTQVFLGFPVSISKC